MLKVPLTAPDMAALDQEAAEKGWSSASELRQGPVVNGEYIHWDKLARLRVPEGLTHRHWWYLVKSARALMRSEIPLRDRDGRPFGYVVVDPIPEWLHRMDMGSGRRVGMAAQVTNPATRDDYLVASLMEEAITSSQLEGAVTTRQVALDMLRSGRPPPTAASA